MQKNGFLLIQVAVILTAFSVIIPTTISRNKLSSESTKRLRTIEKMEVIQKAISEYFTNKGHLPCVGATNITFTDSSFGEEANCNSYTPTGVIALKSKIISGKGNFITWKGIVPTKALGISKDYAIDEWGNKILYHITQKSGISNIVYNDYKNLIEDNANYNTMKILDIDNITLTPTPIPHYILISAGNDSNGAYRMGNIDQSTCTSSRQDGKNCLSSISTFYTGRNIHNEFDNIVLWDNF